MGLIDIFNPLSTVLSWAVNKSLQHQIIFGNAVNQTQGRWVQSENAIQCAMWAPRQLGALYAPLPSISKLFLHA